VSPVPADAWRGIAAEETENMSAGLSSFLRRRSRRSLREGVNAERDASEQNGAGQDPSGERGNQRFRHIRPFEDDSAQT